MSVAHKRHVQVTLDMYVYDDLGSSQNVMKNGQVLGLEGDERLCQLV